MVRHHFVAGPAGFILPIQASVGAGHYQKRIEIVPIALKDFPGSGNRLFIFL